MEKSRGYLSRLIEINKYAPKSHPGVQLGRVCIAQNIPVSDVAEYFGVCRMTIYKWFKGQEYPRKKHVAKIEEIIDKLKNNAHSD